MFFVSCVSHAFTSVHCCLVITCWERSDLLALVGDVYCIFVTFPCGILGQLGTCLYHFLIFAVFLTLYVCLNIGITHVFSCINICRIPRKLFEHEAVRPSVQISSEGPGKC